MIKQISMIALVAIGVTALFFGASIALAEAQSSQDAAQAQRVDTAKKTDGKGIHCEGKHFGDTC
jgi:hypothetical protein